MCFPSFILVLILITAAKGNSSLVSLITPGDNDFIIDLVVIDFVSEDFNKKIYKCHEFVRFVMVIMIIRFYARYLCSCAQPLRQV